jgi:hypothetical protein
MTPPRPGEPRAARRANGADAPIDIDALLQVVTTARSGWVAHQAFVVLLDSTEPDLPALSKAALRASAGSSIPERRRLLTLLSTAPLPDPTAAAVELLEETDPAVRWGAARVLTSLAGTEPTAESVRAQLAQDADMTVRLIASDDETHARRASYWSCGDCAALNEISDLDCANCQTGSRPGRHDVS